MVFELVSRRCVDAFALRDAYAESDASVCDVSLALVASPSLHRMHGADPGNGAPRRGTTPTRVQPRRSPSACRYGHAATGVQRVCNGCATRVLRVCDGCAMGVHRVYCACATRFASLVLTLGTLLRQAAHPASAPLGLLADKVSQHIALLSDPTATARFALDAVSAVPTALAHVSKRVFLQPFLQTHEDGYARMLEPGRPLTFEEKEALHALGVVLGVDVWTESLRDACVHGPVVVIADPDVLAAPQGGQSAGLSGAMADESA
eukprot:1830162-Rhodomonas_salina.1